MLIVNYNCPGCGLHIRLPASAKAFACGCGFSSSSITDHCDDPHRPQLGLGDYLEAAANCLGGRQFKRLHRRLFGRDCGCAARKSWLNRLGERLRQAVRPWLPWPQKSAGVATPADAENQDCYKVSVGKTQCFDAFSTLAD